MKDYYVMEYMYRDANDFKALGDTTQLHQYLNPTGGYIFITEYDEEFAKVWTE